MKKQIVLYLIIVAFLTVSPLRAYFYDSKEMTSILKKGELYDNNGNKIYVSFLPGYEYAGNAMEYGLKSGGEIEKDGLLYIGDGFLTMFTPSEYLGDSFMYGVMGFGFGIGGGIASPFLALQYGYEGISTKIEATTKQAEKTWQRGSFGYMFAYPTAFLKNTSRVLIRTGGIAVAGAIGVVGGVGIVAPLSLTLPVGAILMNPVYGLGKISYGALQFSYGLTVHQALVGVAWPTTICVYNSAVGAPFVLLTRQADYRRISGNFMQLDKDYSIDYPKKLAFEDSISLQQLTDEQEAKLFSLIIDKETYQGDLNARDSISDLLDGWRNYQQILRDSLSILSIKEPQARLSNTENGGRIERKAKQRMIKAMSNNKEAHLASVADQLFLSEEQQVAYTRYRIEKALTNDLYFSQYPPNNKQQVIDSLSTRLSEQLTSKFGYGSQQGKFWSIDIWEDLFGWIW